MYGAAFTASSIHPLCTIMFDLLVFVELHIHNLTSAWCFYSDLSLTSLIMGTNIHEIFTYLFRHI